MIGPARSTSPSALSNSSQSNEGWEGVMRLKHVLGLNSVDVGCDYQKSRLNW